MPRVRGRSEYPTDRRGVYAMHEDEVQICNDEGDEVVMGNEEAHHRGNE